LKGIRSFPILNYYVHFQRLASKSLDLGVPHLKIWSPAVQNWEVIFRIFLIVQWQDKESCMIYLNLVRSLNKSLNLNSRITELTFHNGDRKPSMQKINQDIFTEPGINDELAGNRSGQVER